MATVSWTTDQVLRRLLPEDTAAEWTDSSSSVGLIERDLPAAWAGKKLADLDEPGVFSLAAITRLGTAQVARADLVGQDGDILHVMAKLEAIRSLDQRLADGPDH